MALTVNFAGTSGSAEVEVKDGYTFRDVLLEAAKAVSLPNAEEVVETLAPVADTHDVKLGDEVPAGTENVTAAPNASLG